MMWGCMSWNGVGYAAKIDGWMDSDLYCSILEGDLSSILRKSARISSFNMTMTLNIKAKKPLLGSKITRWSWTGQLNSKISTLLSVFEFISKDSSQHTQPPLIRLMIYESVHKGSGKPLILLWFRI